MSINQKIKILQIKFQSKNFEEVVDGCEEILKKEPNNVYVLNLCGLALQNINKINLSVKFFEKAILIEKDNTSAMNNLANTYKGLGKLSLSKKLYLEVLKIDSKNLRALHNFANLKKYLMDFKGAIKLYVKALNLDQKNTIIRSNLATAYQGVGDLIKAKNEALEVLKIDPNNIPSHKLISSMNKYHEGDPHLSEMEKILINENMISVEDKIDLHYSLGKAYEDIKNFQKSFNHFELANHLKNDHIKYEKKNLETLSESIIKVFRDLDLSKNYKESNNKNIIFIIGMPRSGTTLIEQIISAHKNVSGGGELIYLEDIINENFLKENSLIKQKIVEETKNQNNKIENQYNELLNLHDFKSQIITDKAPHNFRWIGFIKIFFPNSKIIHCVRKPKDNCLSLFKNNFISSSMNWSYSQKNIARYYNFYYNLMTFWKSKISESIYDIHYESLINNPDVEIKKLIKFCNLDWDKNCLNFHKKNKTPIKTVSVSQATKPLYGTSINVSDYYEKNLKIMFKSLNIK